MTLKDYPLKFPDKTTADGLLFDSVTYYDGTFLEPKYPFIDSIGLINGIGWHVNVAMESALPLNLNPYLINPFPSYPVRVRFTNEEGALL